MFYLKKLVNYLYAVFYMNIDSLGPGLSEHNTCGIEVNAPNMIFKHFLDVSMWMSKSHLQLCLKSNQIKCTCLLCFSSCWQSARTTRGSSVILRVFSAFKYKRMKWMIMLMTISWAVLADTLKTKHCNQYVIKFSLQESLLPVSYWFNDMVAG